MRLIQQFNPRGGVYEQSSRDIWQQLCDAVRQASADSKLPITAITGIDVDAICSLVPSASMVAVCRSPMTPTPSATPSCGWITALPPKLPTSMPRMRGRGDDVSVEMELPKVLCLRRHFPEHHASVRRYFDLADYLVWRATGAYVASACTLTCKWKCPAQ